MKASYEQCWLDQIHADTSRIRNKGGNKLRTYTKFKQNFQLEQHLLNIENKDHRKSISQIRLSSHPLRIESQRGMIDDPAMRICPCCTLNSVEDEEHFTVTCPKFEPERNHLILTCKSNSVHKPTLNKCELF